MKTTRPQNFLTLLLCVFFLNTFAQITTDSNPPYNSPIYLVDSLLLGEGVFATIYLLDMFLHRKNTLHMKTLSLMMCSASLFQDLI